MPVIRKEFSLKTRATATALAIFLTGIGLHSWYATSVLQGDMERLLGQQQYSTASYMAADIQEPRALGGEFAGLFTGHHDAGQNRAELPGKIQGLRQLVELTDHAGIEGVGFQVDGEHP